MAGQAKDAVGGATSPWDEPSVSRRTQVVALSVLGAGVVAVLGAVAVWVIRYDPSADLSSAEVEIAVLEADPGFATVPAGSQLTDGIRSPMCSILQSDRRAPYVRRTYRVSGPMSAAVRSLRSALVSGGWTEIEDVSADGRVARTYVKRFEGFRARVATQAVGSQNALVERRGELDVTARVTSPSLCPAG